MSRLHFDEHVLEVTPYTPDWLGVDRSQFVCLDRNESTQPLPEEVAEVLARHIRDNGVHGYPDDTAAYPGLAAYAGVPESHLLLTNGSDQAIDITLRCFLRPGDELLIATPEFAIFRQVADLAGAVVTGIPYEGGSFDFPYEKFRAAAESRPRVIAFINPNNPTGSPVDLDFVREIASTYPDIPVIVDEAYYEFTKISAARFTLSHPNVIVFRTFSKAFAMAGLRLGYVVADPEVIGELIKIRNPFDVNTLAIVAGSAQLQRIDQVQAFANEVIDRIKPAAVAHLTGIGVPVVAGAANFILVKPRRCGEAVRHLRESGILVRSMSAKQLAGMFRVTVGTQDEMARFSASYSAYNEGVEN
ncbi:histidinol-phosphate aminotransferase family protein [Streptomyces sp. NBC_01725]|uniref:pyridoxal phosphate-dependent aminotransferase n=1 Tax=Streptomyces sp. NBC_01725 TaxID=2975923 RepID=UPI002E294155|nr:histidinol-phosphate transaminase [Streptomyces sp. NBC_01725]